MQIPVFDSYKRTELSPETLAVLVDFAAADPARPLRADKVDWNEVMVGLGRHALIGLAYHYLSCNPGDSPPPAFREAVKKAHTLTALRMTLIHRNLFQLLEKINASGLEYLVVKGPAIAFKAYPDPAMRVFNDLDLVIHERDWTRMHEFLEGLGFVQEEDLPEPPPKLHPRMVYYETKYVHPDSRLKVEVHYDDLLNAGLAARDVDGIWQRSLWTDVRGTPVRVLSPEDQMVHLCAHAHYHSYTRLNWFADIGLLLRCGPLNWPRLVEIARREDITVAVYYTLWFIQKLLGEPVPEQALAEMRPDAIRARLHEAYMPEEKVLSMQPMRRFDFSFYFIPLYQRMLPTLLVMGRRKENLAVLARLLAPPRDWLCEYYDIQHPVMVPVNYLIHLPRLFFVYLRESWYMISYRMRGEYYEYISSKKRVRKSKA